MIQYFYVVWYFSIILIFLHIYNKPDNIIEGILYEYNILKYIQMYTNAYSNLNNFDFEQTILDFS